MPLPCSLCVAGAWVRYGEVSLGETGEACLVGHSLACLVGHTFGRLCFEEEIAMDSLALGEILSRLFLESSPMAVGYSNLDEYQL